jgi:hypothetical protein
MDQYITLWTWTYLDIPWKWEKQHHGRSLLMLGYQVDLDTHTFTLTTDSKAQFATTVLSFLAEKDQPLYKWRQLLGYANWALGVIPLAKPLLASSYAKLCGKGRRNGRICLNSSVRSDLAAFRQEILDAPGLDFLSPLLTRWARDTADLSGATDTCLSSDPSDGARTGLGFHLDLGGKTHAFLFRSSSRSKDIYFCEALAILSLIFFVASLPQPPRRLAIYSDNSLSVYAFDSGKARGVYNAIVKVAFRKAQEAGFDFRVFHIPGARNILADATSRHSIDSLVESFSSVSFHPFEPPRDALGEFASYF